MKTVSKNSNVVFYAVAYEIKNGCRLALVGLAVVVIAMGAGSTLFGADEIIAPSGTSSNLPSEFGTATVNVVNQSGLSITYTSGVTDFDAYLAMSPEHDGGPEGFVWLITGSVANFDMDFGSAVTVDAMAVWNKDFLFGVRDFNLLAADNPEFTDAVTLLSDSMAMHPSNPIPTPHEQFDFEQTTAQYYRIEILNNHGAGFTGLGEVAFSVGGDGGCDFALGDVNQDGAVNLLDVTPFIDVLVTGIYLCEADINQDGVVDLLDVGPFVDLLTG